MDENLKEAVELLTLMRWTANTKELCDRVEKFIWEQRRANFQSTQKSLGWTCLSCKTENNIGYRCSWCENPRPRPLVIIEK